MAPGDFKKIESKILRRSTFANKVYSALKRAIYWAVGIHSKLILFVFSF